ncbi:cytochrome P450 [Gonapodya prolifera JEL478]|uniref:Cytochrome P450 n=1 Tax=Gonapodya prolifera (strain JEL478) TaxID=1344416 RepID=A0A139AQR9_GONPJ|nr:cytochrome P450 [Gonapodya prolifera JEL478]|eukprot:KXS19078.1 cytochrome P450 [Gonapodya prolifera JEL478]
MIYAIVVPLILLAIARLLQKDDGIPRISFLHWLFLLVFRPKGLWNKINEVYGNFGVLEVPFVGKAYVVMGPEKSRMYHTSKQLDMLKGTEVVLGDFAPRNSFVNKKFTTETAVKPLASPTFIKDVEKVILKRLAREPWSKGFVPDLFAETWDLALELGFQEFIGIDESCPQQRQLMALFPLLDPEQVMQSPRMWYDKAGLVAETQRHYKEWESLFEAAVKDRKAKRAANGETGPDMLIRVADSATDASGKVDYYDIVRKMWGLIVAAQVNTQANMAWLLIRIGADPALAKRVLDEQEKVLGGRGTPLAGVTPTIKDLAEMEFLERVLAENLRLVSLTFTSFRMTLEDFHIDNYVVPTGSFCIFPHETLCVNPRLYDIDPWEYNPDRTMLFSGSKETDADADLDGTSREPKRTKLVQGGPNANYNLAIWGLGKHPCAGVRYASAVIKMVVSTIVRRYEIELVEGTWPKLPRISLGSSKPYNKVQLRLTPRA